MWKYFHIDQKTLKELIVIAIPMVISQGAFAVMIFTDRYFMSLISPTHMAASLGGGLTFLFCLSFFIGVLSYANALVAQYYGAGHRGKCALVVTQSIFVCVLCIPFLLLMAWGAGNIFSVMGHDPIQEQLEKNYFQILMFGAFFSLSKTCMASYFSGIGSTKVVMIADALGVAVNIFASYILIFGYSFIPAMGIVGAGFGTIVGVIFSLCIFAFFYFHRQHRQQFKVADSFIIDTTIIKQHMQRGIPSGVEMFLNIGIFNVFVLMFQSYGVAQGAAIAIVFNWDMASYVPMLGMNIALISLVGRYVGSRNIEKMDETILAGFLLSLGYSSILAIIFIVFRGALIDVFITPGEYYQQIHSLSSYMIIGLACYTMADAIVLVAGGVLRGAGDTKWLMKASVSLHGLMLFFQTVVIIVLELGPRISWAIFVVMIIVMAIVYLYRLTNKEWRQPDVLRNILVDH